MVRINIGTPRFPLLIIECFLIFANISLSTAYAAKEMTKAGEVLTLEMAIKKAMASNWDILQARNVLRFSKITFDTAFDTMFMPSVRLYTTTSANFSLAQLPGSPSSNLGLSQDPAVLESVGKNSASYTFAKGYPTTAIGIALGQYTLFNFFRDQMAYEKAKLNWEREQQRLIEKERNLRFRVILNYFTNKIEQDKYDAAKRSVDISEAILELVQSKEALGLTKNTDLNSSTVDYLNAKNQLVGQERSVSQQRWNLNLLMGEPISKQFILRTDLEYTPIQLDLEDAYKLFNENSPAARDARLNVKTSEIDVNLAEKDRLPLPRVTLTPISLEYGNRYWGDTRNFGTNPILSPTGTELAPTGNIDIVTSLTFSIPLYGPDGFLGKRVVEKTRIVRDNNDLFYQKTMMESLVNIQTVFATIKQQEQSVTINRESIQNSAKLLETLFSNFSRSGANRLELRDAINQARSVEFSYKDALLAHLERKLALAEYIGVDHLPGEFF